MKLSPLALCMLLCLPLFGQEAYVHSRRFRHYIGGRGAGSLEVLFAENSAHTKNSLSVQRRDSVVEQYLVQDITRDSSGKISARWSISLGSQPHEGRAQWLPNEPEILRVIATADKETRVRLDPGVVLWPPEADEKMRRAARDMAPLQLTTFTFPFSTTSRLDLMPDSKEPLGIFADAIRFNGSFTEGASTSQITCWISPTEGQVKQVTSQGGLIIITQRVELPEPVNSGGPGLFEWTLSKLPHIPFLAWRNEIHVVGLPDIAENQQQKMIAPGEYILSRAEPPTGDDCRQLPIRGRIRPDPEEIQFLADSQLLGINDPAITGLIARLKISPSASRWEICCLVNAFVFDLLRDKGLDVGFATAPEVAVNPKGDCTEHTVLMVALLRRLGVPSRAAFGWVGVDEGTETILGLHAWAEAKIGQRWIPLDPTFDQGPAGAFRVKLNTSALDSYSELGWGMGEAPNSLAVKTKPLDFTGNTLVIDDVTITLLTGRWATLNGRLFIDHPQAGQIAVNGNSRSLNPPDSKLIHVPGRTPARYARSNMRLAMDCGKNRWLYFDGLSEAAAMEVLKTIKINEYSGSTFCS